MQQWPKQMVEVKVCGNCIHYRQHYVLIENGRFKPLWYGHCHMPRPRYPLPDSICTNYQPYEEEPVSQR